MLSTLFSMCYYAKIIKDIYCILQKISWPNLELLPHLSEPQQIKIKCEYDQLTIPNDGTDVWEIDPQLLKFDSKVASGSYGDL